MNINNQNGGWNAGDLVHLIPIANDKSFLIKASFSNPRQSPPILTVNENEQTVPGSKTDVKGCFW